MARGEDVDRAWRRSDALDDFAGDFLLATRVEGHRAGTLVKITVLGPDPSRLALDFGNRDRVLTDACVLLCGSVGAAKLLELGYNGPLAKRPRLAASDGERLHGQMPARA
jgi:hypothetical protein